MKSIIEKRIIKRKYIKRTLGLVVIFIISIFALKHLEKQHPLPKETQTVKDLQKPVKEIKEKQKKPLTVAQKKQLFKDKLVPAVKSAYEKLDKQYNEIKALMKSNPKDPKILTLKEEYNASTNHELLLKLKPHPKSVTLAQAAIESAWGTSRFFLKANNVFGVWSFNKNEPRIPASETRGAKTIYLKKYRTIEESVLDYYKILSKGGAYHKFRVQNYSDPNPYILVTHLDKYSEKRSEYGKILISVIGHNKFIDYDDKFYPRPPKKPKAVEKKEPEQKEVVEVKQETKEELKTKEDSTTQKIEETTKIDEQKPTEENMQSSDLTQETPTKEISSNMDTNNTSKQ